jgi:hypothetical protein
MRNEFRVVRRFSEHSARHYFVIQTRGLLWGCNDADITSFDDAELAIAHASDCAAQLPEEQVWPKVDEKGSP